MYTVLDGTLDSKGLNQTFNDTSLLSTALEFLPCYIEYQSARKRSTLIDGKDNHNNHYKQLSTQRYSYIQSSISFSKVEFENKVSFCAFQPLIVQESILLTFAV